MCMYQVLDVHVLCKSSIHSRIVMIGLYIIVLMELSLGVFKIQLALQACMPSGHAVALYWSCYYTYNTHNNNIIIHMIISCRNLKSRSV